MRFAAIVSLIVMMMGLLLAGGGCQQVGSEAGMMNRSGASLASLDSAGPIEASSATLWVQGMGCPLCANNVDQQLMKIEGVEKVDLNLGTGEVKVALAESNRPTREQLADAIRNSGFTLVKLETQ
jgi:copper chaperone